MISRRVCTFLLLSCVPAAFAGSSNVTFKKSDGRIDVSVAGKEFTTFYYGAPAPKPYLHPLRAADGTIVTRMHPMEDVPGETKDHPHHRGLWFTHGIVNDLDFWANEATYDGPQKPGKITLRKIDKVDDAAGSIRATFDWKTPDGKMVLTEDRAMKFGGDDQLRWVDFDVTFTADGTPVKFGDTKEGFFAIRLATELEEPHPKTEGIKRTGKITNSEGKTGEKDTWGKRATWVDYSGSIQGKPLGIAIFDHPGNPKHPTYWHVRSYGLFAANPFGEHDYYNDKTRDGSVTIAAKKSLRFRYRVLIHPGDVASAKIAEAYKAYVK
jgi:hypothetical protein